MFGGLGKKDTYRGFNRATLSVRQTGSSMKPLCVLVPGIDKKIITYASLSTIFDIDLIKNSIEQKSEDIDRVIKKIMYVPNYESINKTVKFTYKDSENNPFKVCHGIECVTDVKEYTFEKGKEYIIEVNTQYKTSKRNVSFLPPFSICISNSSNNSLNLKINLFILLFLLLMIFYH